MLRKMTVLALAAALVIGGALPVYARGPHGGGGHGFGGGGHGFGGGGRGFGGGGRGFGGGYHGGYHAGYGGYHGGWGGFGTGLGIGAGLGYGLGYDYPYYGGYYNGYYAAPSYYTSPNYYSSAPAYVDPGYTTNDMVVPSTSYVSPAISSGMGYTSSSRSMPAQNDTAQINIRVPANAKVFFDNVEASNLQSGSERHFVSPPLDPGRSYQ